jgi:hypothetical protein
LVTSGSDLTAGDIPNIAQSQVTNLVSDLALKVDKVSAKSLVDNTEITKLQNLDPTTDLQKPLSIATINALALKLASGGYTGTAEDLRLLIINSTTGVTGTSVTPSSTPTGTGIASWIALQAGTYTDFGGVVVGANSFAVISRSATNVYTISQTTLDISSKVNVADVIDTLNSTETAKPLSANQGKLLNDKKADIDYVSGVNLEKLGLTNTTQFFIGEKATAIANAILKLSIEVDDSIATAAEIRLYAVFNRLINPEVTLVFKNFTTDASIILFRPNGTNTGIVNLSGNSDDGLIKIKATVNLDFIPYDPGFDWYEFNTTVSAKFSFLKFSEVLQNKEILDSEIANINAEFAFIDNDLTAIKTAALGFDNTLVFTNESVDGYYRNDNGVFYDSAGHHSRKYTIGLNRDIYASGTVAGSGIALANYYTTAGVFISAEFTSLIHDARVYNRQKLNIPNNCVYIGISTRIDTPYGLMEQGIVDIVTSEELALNSTSTKIGKSMVWFGTSIPETGYPALIATKLGCIIYNEAVGSSPIRAFASVSGNQKGLYYEPALRSLSQTVAEKQAMIDNWTTGLNSSGIVTGGGTFGWRDLLLGSPPAILSTYASNATILGWSYEKKLVAKYLDTTSPDFIEMPDYFILDHGHNDLVVYEYDYNDVAAIAIPATRNDRKFFNGAMNYIIDVILSYNPRANIVLIGHYENDRKITIHQAQNVIAEYWDFPFLKLWEKMGFTQQIVPTTGYWSDANTWNPTGGSLTNKTLTQIWMYDDLHPNSTLTKEKFANVLLRFINEL